LKDYLDRAMVDARKIIYKDGGSEVEGIAQRPET
jgi:hypothetical protein